MGNRVPDTTKIVREAKNKNSISNERGQILGVVIVIITGRAAAAVEARDRGRRKQHRLPSSGELLHHVLVVCALADRWQARARHCRRPLFWS